jgi:lysozyme family protein
MADFSKAFGVSFAARGGDALISEDGEIYRGINRRFHPAWDGWPIIDALKFAASDETELRSMLGQNRKLGEKVVAWFKQMYWDRFSGDRIPNQEIGAELFESSLELGVGRAVNCLQKSLNLLNAGRSGTSIVEDGRLEQGTVDALEVCLRNDGATYVLNVMRILQALHYIGRLKKNPGQDLFARAQLGHLLVTRRNAQVKPAPPMGLRVED